MSDNLDSVRVFWQHWLMSFWYTRFIIETHLGDTFVLYFISIIVCIKNIFGILRKTFFCYNQVMSMCYDRRSRSQLCLLSSGVLNFPFLSVKILIVVVARMVPHMTRTGPYYSLTSPRWSVITINLNIKKLEIFHWWSIWKHSIQKQYLGPVLRVWIYNLYNLYLYKVVWMTSRR